MHLMPSDRSSVSGDHIVDVDRVKLPDDFVLQTNADVHDARAPYPKPTAGLSSRREDRCGKTGTRGIPLQKEMPAFEGTVFSR